MRSLLSVSIVLFGASLASLCSACSSRGGDSAATEEDLARKAFAALNEASPAPFEGCLPTPADFGQRIEAVREKGSERDLRAAQAYLRSRAAPRSARRNRRGSPSTACRRPAKFLEEEHPPIDWSKAEFAGLSPEHAESWIERGYRHGNLCFRINSGDVFYTIKIEEVRRVDRGWTRGDGTTTYRDSEGPGVESLKREEARKAAEAERAPRDACRLTVDRMEALRRALYEFTNANKGFPESLADLGSGSSGDGRRGRNGLPAEVGRTQLLMGPPEAAIMDTGIRIRSSTPASSPPGGAAHLATPGFTLLWPALERTEKR